MSDRNCVFDAGTFGIWEVWAESVSHGFRVLSTETQTRRYRTFYPRQKTSDAWFVNIVFDSHEKHQTFSLWLSDYFRAVSDPYADTPAPITVSIPSRNFSKRGYPATAMSFGDELGKVVYRESIRFVSVDALTNDTDVSGFVGPSTDVEAYYFYPPGIQPGDLVNPSPGPLIGVVGDDATVYGSGGGGGAPRHVL